MSKILLYGAGKSATVLIDYLVVQCSRQQHAFEIVDAFPGVAQEKMGTSCMRAGVDPSAFEANTYSIDDASERRQSIRSADLVISLLPPHLHAVVASDCLTLQRPLFTASYVDDKVMHLRKEIESRGLLFLYEMGLDPGIDHMSLMGLLHDIRALGGKPISIRSHCGGLVSPESDDNPWHYKISWNPRNVVMAGMAGAQYLEGGQLLSCTHAQLFEVQRLVDVPGAGQLAYYPNRDSISYLDRYGLNGLQNFVRTTLRHPDFIRGWSALIQLGLIDPQRTLDLSNQATLSKALNQYFPLPASLDSDLCSMLEWLGWSDESTTLPFSQATPAELIQFCMEQKWVLGASDKDRVVMLHEVEYMLGAEKKSISSWLVQDGEDSVRTAMAKTVGLPLGIAAMQYLSGELKASGLQIPILPEIYKPVMRELADHGIVFQESEN